MHVGKKAGGTYTQKVFPLSSEIIPDFSVCFPNGNYRKITTHSQQPRRTTSENSFSISLRLTTNPKNSENESKG